MTESFKNRIPDSVEQVIALLGDHDYVADQSLAVTLLLALRLGRPVFLEGEPGVGKTEVAKVLACALGAQLIRLQCYEGIDISTAVYEWNYPAQMLAIRMSEASPQRAKISDRELYQEEYLIKRPLLKALDFPDENPNVLLIDELDRADEPFEAYLLELLSDFQVSIPELGVIKAKQPPVVIITSNRTREIHDALKRRCFYCWVDYPDLEREYDIVKLKAPDSPQVLLAQIVSFMQLLRHQDLYKTPGVAETIDWANALGTLNIESLDPAVVDQTLGVVLKYKEDIESVDTSKIETMLNDAQMP